MATKVSKGANLTTSEIVLYEVPTHKRAEWVMLYATNIGNSNKKFNVRIYKASDNAHLPVFDSFIVNTKDFFHIGGNINEFIYLEEGDQIKVSGDSNNDITLLVSVIEHNSMGAGN